MLDIDILNLLTTEAKQAETNGLFQVIEHVKDSEPLVYSAQSAATMKSYDALALSVSLSPNTHERRTAASAITDWRFALLINFQGRVSVQPFIEYLSSSKLKTAPDSSVGKRAALLSLTQVEVTDPLRVPTDGTQIVMTFSARVI